MANEIDKINLTDTDVMDAIGETFSSEVARDTEPHGKIGFHLVKEYQNASEKEKEVIDNVLLAVCGWTLQTLVNKSVESLSLDEFKKVVMSGLSNDKQLLSDNAARMIYHDFAECIENSFGGCALPSSEDFCSIDLEDVEDPKNQETIYSAMTIDFKKNQVVINNKNAERALSYAVTDVSNPNGRSMAFLNDVSEMISDYYGSDFVGIKYNQATKDYRVSFTHGEPWDRFYDLEPAEPIFAVVPDHNQEVETTMKI